MSSRKHPSPSSTEVYANANKKVRISSNASEFTLDNVQHLSFTALPDNILNKQYTSPDYIANFRTAFRNRLDFYDPETTSKVYSHPFPIAVLPRLFSDSFLEKVKQELVTEEFTPRSNDLYEFYQSNSLEGVEKTYLSQLTRVIYSEWFARLIGALTGVEVDGETVDLSAHIYKQEKKNGHIDLRKLLNEGKGGRRIAFIIYLVDENWGKEDGGTLDLFDIDSLGHPNKVKRSIVPEWNSMAFFEVSPTSYHQVSEVVAPTKPRISISGWFHGSLKSRLSIAEYRTVDELSREEEDFDISEFINEEYCSDEAIDRLLKMIHLRGSVELRGFLKEEVYVRLLESLAKDAEWDENPIGPPFVRKYHLLKENDRDKNNSSNNNNNINPINNPNRNDGQENNINDIKGKSKAPLPAPFHTRVEKFFQSSAFQMYLENLTHLKFGAVSSETRQFRRGNYIIAHDQAADHAGVDVVFSCIRDKWDEEWEGATIYYAENKELPVHVLWPMRNTLTITERIDGIHRFQSSSVIPTLVYFAISPIYMATLPPISSTGFNGSNNNNVGASNHGNWQHDLLVKLLVRDRREKAFTDFVDSYNSLVQKLGKFADQNGELESTTRAVKEENAVLLQEVATLRDQGSPLNQKRTAELEKQIYELKEERATLYKTQGQNAQRLVDLNDVLRKSEETAKKNNEEIQRLTETNTTLMKKVESQTLALGEKDVTIQILQDELATLQLELVKTEERMKDLEKENGQLLQRWLKKMNDEVEKMNEANSALDIHAKALEVNSGVVIVEKEQIVAMTEPTTATISPMRNDRTRGKSVGPVTIPVAAFRKFTAHDGEIHAINCSTDGNLFATGSSDKTIKVFDAKTGNLKQTLSGSLQSIMHLSFNNTNDMIAGASNDNSTRIWDLRTARIWHTLTGHIGKVYSARFNGDSTRMITGSHDRTIRVFDLNKGYCIKTIFCFSSCNDVVLIDESGSTLASGHLDNNLRFWDVRSGKDIKELTGIHLGQITSVAVSPDGSKVMTNSRDNTIKLVDLRTYEVVQTLHADGYKNGTNWSRACYSPDGRYVAAGSIDGTIYYWNLFKSRLEKTLKEHSAPICGVAWSPQGSQVFSADKDRTVCIWASGLR
ncbi:12339_t:CDS:10 [Ambispora leptoticha]|uniref:12339_t:CDS:1 n=1 Tax=Ambispora leptoticha TaxID=144679 RepID=A0A9N8ZD83_9GLOM|nr:12339_t:CDS:10 [Ambispora leptoticha]